MATVSGEVTAYLRDAAVRARIREYAGAHGSVPPTAAFLAGLYPDGAPFLTWERAECAPPAAYDALADAGGDIARSLWDTESLLLVLDLDYLNIDAPVVAFAHPADVFLILEPVFRATRAVLRRVGIAAFTVMTGRGYHFVGRVPLDLPLVDALATLVPAPPAWHEGHERRRPRGVDATITPRHARAAAGLGLLVEFLAHEVLRQVRGAVVPVVFNGTIVGRGLRGRECVSLDFSHVGDPLDIRMIRVPFGPYQWHRFRPDIFGPAAAAMPPLIALPRLRRSLTSLLMTGRSLATGRRLATTVPTRIPDVSNGVTHLLARYRRSKLAAFHAAFNEEHASPRPLDLDVPTCVGRAFEHPNDLLLKPEHIQHVVRVLMSRGWRPRQIADAVAERYGADVGWGARWSRMDLRTRADFDVRVFAGLIVAGLDPMIDFNCVSALEKDICPQTGCPSDLRVDRDRLLRRDSWHWPGA